MRNRSWISAGLALAVLGLAALLLLDRTPPPQPERLTPLTIDQVARLSLQQPNAPTLAAERRDDGWHITQPFSARAERNELMALLKLAEAQARRSFAAGDADAAELGLAEPAATLTLNNTRIRLGATDPIDSKRYAQRDDRIFLINNPPQTALDDDYSDFVARDLLPDNSHITRLQLPTATLTRNDAGGWTLTPDNAAVSADDIQYTIDAWQRARALWNRPADTDTASQGELRIAFEQGGQQGERRLQVMARSPQLILRDPDMGVNFHVAANQAAPLLDLTHPTSAAGADATLKKQSDIPVAPDAGAAPR